MFSATIEFSILFISTDFDFNCFLSTFLKLDRVLSVFICSATSSTSLIASFMSPWSFIVLNKFSIIVHSTSSSSCDLCCSHKLIAVQFLAHMYSPLPWSYSGFHLPWLQIANHLPWLLLFDLQVSVLSTQMRLFLSKSLSFAFYTFFLLDWFG